MATSGTPLHRDISSGAICRSDPQRGSAANINMLSTGTQISLRDAKHLNNMHLDHAVVAAGASKEAAALWEVASDFAKWGLAWEAEQTREAAISWRVTAIIATALGEATKAN